MLALVAVKQPALRMSPFRGMGKSLHNGCFKNKGCPGTSLLPSTKQAFGKDHQMEPKGSGLVDKQDRAPCLPQGLVKRNRTPSRLFFFFY